MLCCMTQNNPFYQHRTSFEGKSNPSLVSPKEVYEYCFNFLSSLDRECFLALHLDSKNKCIAQEIISLGTLNSTLVHPREVFKSAIKNNSNSIILVHNHPSGDPTPSNEDKKITKVLFKAGRILGIKVLDHVIVGKDQYWSLNEKNN